MQSINATLVPGLGQRTGGTWQFAHADLLGSLRSLTNAQGQVITTQQYTPFGAVDAPTGAAAPWGFTGAPQDATSGLTYLRARYYHPTLGRFLTPDALVPDGLNGQAWHGYAYVYNNVANLVDPSGYTPISQQRAKSLDSTVAWLMQTGKTINNWWQQSQCTCTASGNTRAFENIAIKSAGYAGAATFDTYFNSVTTIITTKTESRGIYFEIERSARGIELVRPSNKPPYTPWTTTYEQRTPHWSEWRTTGTHVLEEVADESGNVFYRRTRQLDLDLNFGLKGMLGSTISGAAFGAVWDLAQGLHTMPCLSPQERTQNVLKEFNYGLGLGVFSSGVSTFLAAKGAPPVVTFVGSYIATIVASEKVGDLRQNGALP